MKKLLLIFVLLAGHAWATILTVGYVAQTAQGSGDGLSSGNAASLANHNANTIPGGTITSGTACTIHLVGTLTTQLVTPVSGTSGHLITYLFDSGANLTAATWGDTTAAAINLNGKNFVVIDGGSNGLIATTNNGTTLGIQQNSCGIYGEGSHDVTIQNLTIGPMYQRTQFSTTDTNRFGQGTDVGNGSNWVIKNCTMFGGDTMIGMIYTVGTTTGWVISGNTISNCNHGLGIGTADTSGVNLNGMAIYNNTIDHLDYWGGVTGNHLDGMILFNNTANTSVTMNDCLIYNNKIGPNIGTINTAAIFIESFDAAQVVNLRIYDNIFTQTTPASWSNGFISLSSSTDSFVFNNTFVAYDTGGAGTSTGIGINFNNKSLRLTLQNNVFSRVGTPMSVGSGASWPTGLVSNHNDFFDVGSGSGSFYGPSFAAGTLSYWQGQGYDLDAVTTTPNLDGSYFPVATSAAIGAGVDESAYFTLDKSGVAWAGGTGWGLGALKVASGGDTTPPTPNPSTIASTSVLGTTSLSVTATTSTDAGSPPVLYRFSKDGGSTWTGYQSSPTYSFTGLTPNTGYPCQVQAEDSASTPNVTTASGSTTVTTQSTNNIIPTTSRRLNFIGSF